MRLLGEQPERQAALAMDLAAVGLIAAGGQPEEGRLAGAVGSDQADPVTQRDRGVDRVEDDEGADLTEGITAYNPAFDVTPASLIAGIITERG